MVANINAEITICETVIHIYNISTAGKATQEKAYYQHRHPSLELHYVINGKCKATCSGIRFDLDDGFLLLVPPGAYHDVIPTTQSTRRLCLSFSMQKKRTSNDREKTDLFHNIFNRNVPVCADLKDSESQHILLRMTRILDDPQDDPYKNDKLLTMCGNLLLELIPHITDAAAETTASQSSLAQEDVSFKIDSFLGTNFMYNNAKSRIAADLYISPRQLQRIIKKNYGMNYRQKLSETRIQIAVDLLCNSDMAIHKISEILGYSCSANFSAFIKRTTGKTPSQIRKERQKMLQA